MEDLLRRPRPAVPPAPQIEGPAAGHAGHEAITQTKHGAERPAQGLRACIFVHVIMGLSFLPLLAAFLAGGLPKRATEMSSRESVAEKLELLPSVSTDR